MTTPKSKTYKELIRDNPDLFDDVPRVLTNDVCIFCGVQVPSSPDDVVSRLSIFDNNDAPTELKCNGHRRSFIAYCAYLDNAYQRFVGLNLDEIVRNFYLFEYAFWDCGCLPMDGVCRKVFPHFTVNEVLVFYKKNLLGAARHGDVDWGDIPIRFMKDRYSDHWGSLVGTWEDTKMPSIWPMIDVRSFLGYLSLCKDYLGIAKDYNFMVYNRDEIDENELFKIRVMVIYANHRTYISGIWRNYDFITLLTVEVSEHSIAVLQCTYSLNEIDLPPLPYNPLNWPISKEDIVPTYPLEEPRTDCSTWTSDLFSYGVDSEFSDYFPLDCLNSQ